MKSWKISGSPHKGQAAGGATGGIAARSSSADGNFDAMSKQQAAAISGPRKQHSALQGYSPLRYMPPSRSASNDSNALLKQSRRSSHSNNRPTGGANAGHSASTTSFTTDGSGKYFQDLDEDWSAVIDDYNMPIPVYLNGGSAGTADSLSRASTHSYPQLPNLTGTGSGSRGTPGPAVVPETRTPTEIAQERDVQELNSMMARITKFNALLSSKHILNVKELRQLSWNGIPKPNRPKVWKLLIGYLPANTKRHESFLQRKRKEYRDGITHTFDEQNHQRDIPTWHQIEIDLPRTNPSIPLYQFKSVQHSLQKILYLWAIRHPASGYVQGINDLVTPFYQIFLTEYLPASQIDEVANRDPAMYMSEEQTVQLEADTFWCLTKLLEQITDNYIHGQPGILKQVKNLSQLVKRIDADLYDHFTNEHVEFIQFAFRWMNCLLMREFEMDVVIRMWDTYLAETSQDSSVGGATTGASAGADLSAPTTPAQRTVSTFQTPPSKIRTEATVGASPSSPLSVRSFSATTAVTKTTASGAGSDDASGTRQSSSLNEFHVFVCAAFLIKWSDQLCGMDFQEIITFLQNPPTKDWRESDIEMLLSEAYIWQSLYKDATSHWL
ncbi:GTPase-activating protein GYP1 KNAG_0L01940 [Huiozyma naganishii CBS 8797]|uniref:Rab-GAP TBC domain-containing protein n=1 Tax=Huiozyma naganishii (strain ATCC MYA-139 / BCRC 22969 / CBS 8797 / KCTC 17520 / NBRC 10181 / NCYC 3082 / Yp74L-3) TaxID=1071383 RepID=J7RSB9_HUIN7|nr:hypothetical protein KNAG_0L01940 [Kazachstania naganishii CBS 8797]CCK72813.1 hypothetical protein KNAG_0L01940 [Kazachstania naganishii CBS 8797]